MSASYIHHFYLGLGPVAVVLRERLHHFGVHEGVGAAALALVVLLLVVPRRERGAPVARHKHHAVSLERSGVSELRLLLLSTKDVPKVKRKGCAGEESFPIILSFPFRPAIMAQMRDNSNIELI